MGDVNAVPAKDVQIENPASLKGMNGNHFTIQLSGIVQSVLYQDTNRLLYPLRCYQTFRP